MLSGDAPGGRAGAATTTVSIGATARAGSGEHDVRELQVEAQQFCRRPRSNATLAVHRHHRPTTGRTRPARQQVRQARQRKRSKRRSSCICIVVDVVERAAQATLELDAGAEGRRQARRAR